MSLYFQTLADACVLVQWHCTRKQNCSGQWLI